MTYVIFGLAIIGMLALAAMFGCLVERFLYGDDETLVDLKSTDAAPTCSCVSMNADWGAGSGFHEANLSLDPHCQVHGDGRA